MSASPVLIELVDVRKIYRVGVETIRALNGVSLTIGRNEMVAVMGSSGSGKSTLMNVLGCLDRPTSGSYRLAGQPVDRMSAAELARVRNEQIGFVFQSFELLSRQTALQNVELPLIYARRRAGDPWFGGRRKRALAALERVGLGHRITHRPNQLSGGQKQRVAIARALAVEPSVLLLDEPLSALDLKLRQHMRAELRALQKRTGVTFIYITHDQGEALTMSDRVAVMSQGRIEQTGTAAEIYNHPATSFVATFVGENNAFFGRVRGVENGHAVVETRFGLLRGQRGAELRAGDPAIVFVRPERCRLGAREGQDNRITSKVARLDLEGAYTNLIAEGDRRDLVVHLTNEGRETPLSPGDPIEVGFPPEAATVLREGPLAAG